MCSLNRSSSYCTMLICLLVHGIRILLKLFVTDKTYPHLKALYCPSETHQQNVRP